MKNRSLKYLDNYGKLNFIYNADERSTQDQMKFSLELREDLSAQPPVLNCEEGNNSIFTCVKEILYTFLTFSLSFYITCDVFCSRN